MRISSHSDRQGRYATRGAWAVRALVAFAGVAVMSVMMVGQASAATRTVATAGTIVVNVINDTTPPYHHTEGVNDPAIAVGTFTDPNACPTTCNPTTAYTLAIHWGDHSRTSTTPTVAFVSQSGTSGTYSVTDSHTFPEEFNSSTVPNTGFTVHVDVTSATDTGKASGFIAVKDQPLDIITPQTALTTTAGTPISNQIIGTFHDENQLSNAIDNQTAGPEFAIATTWGDGSAVDNSGTVIVGTCATVPGAAPNGCDVNVVGSHTFATTGTYTVGIDVRDGQGFSTHITNTVTVTPGTTCTATGLSANPASSATAGTQVVVTATPATPCQGPQYEFWVEYPANTGPWVSKQAYGSSNVFNWDSSTGPTGQYRIGVWARQAGHTAPYEATAQIPYTLTAAPKCTAGGLAVSPATTDAAGTALTLTGSSATCPSPLYEFWLQFPANTGTWVLKQSFSTVKTWNWDTTGAVPGAYRVSVWVTQSGDSTSTYETYGLATVTLTGCTSDSVVPSPSSPKPKNTTVQLPAASTGCANTPMYQYWIQTPGSSTWTIFHAYSATTTWPWTGTAAGTYHFSVWVIDSKSGGASGNASGRWDAYFAFSYTLT